MISWKWLFLLALFLQISSMQAQFGMGGPKGPEPTAVRGDIKYIRCDVCEHLAKQAFRQAGAFKKELAQKTMKHERKVHVQTKHNQSPALPSIS